METDNVDEPTRIYYPIEIAEKVKSGEYRLHDRPARSRVWKIFARVLNENGEEIRDYVYCKNCKKVFKFHKLTTSNLVKHKCYANWRDMGKTASIVQVEKPRMEIEVHENSVSNLTKLMARCIIKDCRPYDSIQTESLQAVFQEFMWLGSKFGGDINVVKFLPNISDVEKNVSEIYEQCFYRVKSEIASIKENGFGLTADTWTNNSTKQCYIALTIHYVKSGVLTFRLLGLKILEDGKNTSIVEKIKQILNDFDCKLSSKTIIVTDGVGDIFKALPDAQSVSCISHLLNSVLLKSMEEVTEASEMISACTKLVNFLKKIENLDSVLSESLQTAYPNRFITVHKMLSSVDSNWDEISKILQSRKESGEIFAININHLRAVIKTFEPFEEAIETLEEDDDATLHLVMVYMHELKKTCDTNDSEFKDLDFIENLKETIRFYLKKIVTENIITLHKLALFLYPPTNKLLQFSDKEKIFTESECLRLMKSFKNELNQIVKQEPGLPTAPVSKRRKLFSDFVESEANPDPHELINQELQYYKTTRVVNSGDFNAFSWWDMHKSNFPILYKLSCAVLATPATSAASRRIFSAASGLLSGKSMQVSEAADIEKIIFINSNAEHDELDSHSSVKKDDLT